MTFSSSSYTYTSGYRGSMSQIYDMFSTHRNSLIDRQWEAKQAIDEWSNGLIQQIRDHAQKQKDLVDEAYKIHQKHLENMCDQFVETSRVYEQENDAEEIKRILEKCRTLKVELVNITFPSVNKEFIEITLVKPPDQMDQEELNLAKTGGDRFKNSSIGRNETGSVSDRDLYSGSYSATTTSTSDRTKNQSSPTRSMYSHDLSKSTNDNNNQKTDLNNDDNSIDKCPMCFMIFPSYMSTMARSMHVAEHCKDD